MRYLGGLALIFLIACGATTPRIFPTPTITRLVTIDGRDTDRSIVTPINLWDGYPTHTRVVGTVHHGERVDLLNQAGAGCRVRATTGVIGWLTCANFVQEFKHVPPALSPPTSARAGPAPA